MKVLKANIDWHEGFDNEPRLQVLVDKMNYDKLKYEPFPITRISGLSGEQAAIVGTSDYTFKGRDTVLYYAANKGLVRFLYHDPQNEHGYDGNVFQLILTNGETIKIKGPWSSRAGVVNQLVPDDPNLQCVDVSITDKPEVFEKGFTYPSGTISLKLAKDAIMYLNNIHDRFSYILSETYCGSDRVYQVRRKTPYSRSFLPQYESILLQTLEHCHETLPPNEKLSTEAILISRITRYMNKHYTDDWPRLVDVKQPQEVR